MKVYQTHGACSSAIELDIDDAGVITHCRIVGGCPGNTRAVSMLVIGMKAADAAEQLRGIPCRPSGTSCPDQLARAIDAYLAGK